MPSVFIGVPTFGRPNMLRRALESIQAQTFQNFEVLVSDNGNSQESLEVVRSFSDPRFKYFGQPKNLGLVGNWNFLKSAGHSDLWSFLEDDNFWDPTHLAEAVAAFASCPRAAMWFCESRDYWDKDGTLTPFRDYPKTRGESFEEDPASCGFLWLSGSRCPSSSVVIRGEVWDGVAPFDIALPFCHDYLQWATIGTKHQTVRSTNPTVSYTYHADNAVGGLVLSRAAGRQMRTVRRQIAEWLLGSHGMSSAQLSELLATNFSDEEIGQVIPALMAAPKGSNVWQVGKYLWEKRVSARSVSGHMRAAASLGPWYFKFCDHVDQCLGKVALVKRRLSA